MIARLQGKKCTAGEDRNRVTTLVGIHTRATIARRTPDHATMGADMRTEIHTATGTCMKAGLNTRIIPITATTNIRGSNRD